MSTWKLVRKRAQMLKWYLHFFVTSDEACSLMLFLARLFRQDPYATVESTGSANAGEAKYTELWHALKNIPARFVRVNNCIQRARHALLNGWRLTSCVAACSTIQFR